ETITSPIKDDDTGGGSIFERPPSPSPTTLTRSPTVGVAEEPLTLNSLLALFPTYVQRLDWSFAHNFLTCLQKLSSYASGHLEVSELAACLEKASFSSTSGHVKVFWNLLLISPSQVVTPKTDENYCTSLLKELLSHLGYSMGSLDGERIGFVVKMWNDELNPFLDNSEESKKSKDDWELILNDIDFGDIPELKETSLPSFVCKMGKSARNKKRPLENYQMNYSDEGPPLTNKKPLTQEKAACEAITIDIYKKISIHEEARPIIKTMTYSDRYKKILDIILLDKLKLDGEIKLKEEEEAINRVMGGHKALKEKEDPGLFIILIRFEVKINLNALADIDSNINVMPFRIYTKLGRDEVKPVNRGIIMLNRSKVEPSLLQRSVMLGGSNHHYCKVFDFGYACGQRVHATKTNMNTEESDSDNNKDYCIKRDSLGAPIYRPNSLKYLNCSDPMNRALALQENGSQNMKENFVEKKIRMDSGKLKLD
nr:hypothetical protein [Tanacetum cinerariifolium]